MNEYQLLERLEHLTIRRRLDRENTGIVTQTPPSHAQSHARHIAGRVELNLYPLVAHLATPGQPARGRISIERHRQPVSPVRRPCPKVALGDRCRRVR